MAGRSGRPSPPCASVKIRKQTRGADVAATFRRSACACVHTRFPRHPVPPVVDWWETNVTSFPSSSVVSRSQSPIYVSVHYSSSVSYGPFVFAVPLVLSSGGALSVRFTEQFATRSSDRVLFFKTGSRRSAVSCIPISHGPSHFSSSISPAASRRVPSSVVCNRHTLFPGLRDLRFTKHYPFPRPV